MQSVGPLPTSEQVLACQFSRWYTIFSNVPENSLGRSNVTIRSRVFALPPSFKNYMLADGVRLPLGANTSGLLTMNDDASSGWSESSSVEVESQSSQEEEPIFDFADLCREMQAAIDSLGGEVMPKLNWSAPKDATWVNGSTLKCTAPGDVFLLLKSSDFCLFDVNHALDEIADPDSSESVALVLVLRKWCNLYPNQEFRCFVCNNELVAISQRHHSQSFKHLVRDQYMIRSLLIEFFDEIIQPNFTSMPNYVFDAYIDKKERVWLIDFNVWGRRTDALLYSWEELEGLDSDTTEIRVVRSEKEIKADPLSSYRAPIDALYMTSLTGGDSKKFEEFMSLCRHPTAPEDELSGRQDQYNERISNDS